MPSSEACSASEFPCSPLIRQSTRARSTGSLARKSRACSADDAQVNRCPRVTRNSDTIDSHVRIIFYEQDMRHRLTSSINGLAINVARKLHMLKRRFTFPEMHLIVSSLPALPTTQPGPTKSLHRQSLGPKLLGGWGAGRPRSRVCAAGSAEIRPTEPGRACPAKGSPLSPRLPPYRRFARRPSSSAPGSWVWGLPGGWPKRVARWPSTTAPRPDAARAGRRPECSPPRSKPSPARRRCSP